MGIVIAGGREYAHFIPSKGGLCHGHAGKTTAVGSGPAGASATENPDLHLYERAMELFNACNFQAARESFLTLTNSTNRDLAYSAGQRVKMCNRRLGNLIEQRP